MGMLISFEGTDGCGKSTQIKMLAEYLQSKGVEVVVSREPGGNRIGEQIREILLNGGNTELCPMCELFLYEAARAQNVNEVVLPALKAGKTVILDRFIDSTFAYQGYGRGLSLDDINCFNRAAIGGRYPDVTLLLELSPSLAFERKGGNDKNDRMEMAGDEFFSRVREGFEQAQKDSGGRIVKINVSGTKEETHKKIRDVIDGIPEGK